MSLVEAAGLKAYVLSLRAGVHAVMGNIQQATADIAKAEQLQAQARPVHADTQTYLSVAKQAVAEEAAKKRAASPKANPPNDVAYAKQCAATCKSERERCMSSIAMDFTRSLSESTRNCDSALHSCRMYCPGYGID